MARWTASLRRRMASWLAAAVWVCGATSVQAEPLIHVRAESRIELGVSYRAPSLRISGALRDELGAALAERTIRLEATPLAPPGQTWLATVTSDAQGRFRTDLMPAERDYRLVAVFEGDPTHRGVKVERQVERARADVRLELRLPSAEHLDLDAPTVPIEVVAESDAGGQGLTMRLTNEKGAEVARGVTNAEGSLTLEVRSAALGPAGPGVLRIESLRDETRAEAQTEARVVRQRSSRLSITGPATSEAGRTLQLRGRARTLVGPRSHVPVGLFVGERHMETVLTDAQGRFGAELWLDGSPGPVRIVARVEGDAAGSFLPAEAALQVTVRPSQPLPASWLAVAVLGALGLLWLWPRRRAPSGPPLPTAAGATRGPSVTVARAKGRRDRFEVIGQVTDSRSERPIAHAEVQIRPADGDGAVLSLRTDAAGRFASEALPAGVAQLEIAAPGFARASARITIPHRGEWSDCFIRMESLRARALLPYKKLALRALPRSHSWGVTTTREARTWVERKHPQAAGELLRIAREVESACYGPAAPTERAVAALEASIAVLDGHDAVSSARKTDRSRAVR